jgi:uncharacterized damage-inducible protein DinB
MRRRKILSAIAAAPVLTGAQAQWSNPFLKTVRDTFIEHWRDTREYTLAIFDAMPADGFDSKPHPAQRTFGEQMVHTGLANIAYYNAFGLIERPQAPKEITRESARAFLAASFDYTAQVLEKLTERDLQRADLNISARLKPHSAVDIFLRGYMHTAHHRGQAVVYLRVRGITPPAWKFEPTA